MINKQDIKYKAINAQNNKNSEIKHSVQEVLKTACTLNNFN